MSEDLSRYATIRMEYLQRLDEENLLTRDNLIKPELIDSAGLYGPDSPWAQICERHPTHPICTRISPREEVDQLVDIHLEYLEQLEEEGLLGIRQMMIDIVDWCGTPPGKWPFPFPPQQSEFDERIGEVMQIERQVLF